MEKFLEVVEEMSRFEVRLKEEDFSGYSREAIDCERKELEMLWVKYKTIYETCSSEKKVHT